MHDRAISHMMVRVGLAVFGLLTLAIVLLTFISERGLLAVHRREAELHALHEQIESKNAENEAILAEIENLQNPYGGEVERHAREDLDMARPDQLILPEAGQPD
jgi:cell division protein FtsB